jgi:hypothetical protein
MGGNPRVELADLLEAVAVAEGALAAAGVDFALCGSLAAYGRGGTLMDHDVDFLIRAEQADLALETLESVGMRTERPPEDWLVKAYHGDVLIDLIFRPVERPVTERTLANTDILPVGSVRLPVLSATELLIHSLGTISDQRCDMSEPLRIARGMREQIDLERVRDETKESPYARAFLVLAEDLQVLTRSQDE